MSRRDEERDEWREEDGEQRKEDKKEGGRSQRLYWGDWTRGREERGMGWRIGNMYSWGKGGIEAT